MWGFVSLWFWLAFLWWWVLLSIFPCSFWPFICFLRKNVSSNPLPILIGSFGFFSYWVVYVLHILIYVFITYMVCKYFLPFSSLPFTLLIVSFDVQKVFTLMQSHLFCFVLFLFFCFCYLCFCGFIQKKSLPRPISRSFSLLFQVFWLNL